MSKKSEDEEFKAWLRTLKRLPAEIPNNDDWNNRVVMETFDYVTKPPKSTK